MQRESIGRIIAGHRIEALLGEGGMGVVYRARHQRLGKVRALKLLPPQLAQDESFRERFEHEWRLAASIEHPNIVEVIDAGEADENLYILMRLIEGPDLQALVKKNGPLTPERTLIILEQIADALDAAHAQGLVHRDVSTRNILVEGDDRAFLVDFGIAQTKATHGLTRTGFFVGNPEFASPEQIEGKEVDSRADVYALGGVLYTCLTADSPFAADSEIGLINAHLHNAPPVPSLVRPGLPASLDRVVERAMSKSPASRYQTCGELVTAIRSALRGPQDVVKPTRVEAVGERAHGGDDGGGIAPSDSAPLKIFINYRRGDSSGYAGRLYDTLSERSPEWQVFMDVDTIEPGTDFVEVIDTALDSCDVVIAVIGRQWATAANAKGQRRLDDPNDFVRVELTKALERKIRVIPALVQGIEMPAVDEIPEELAPLARRHALELSDARWRYDVDRLAQLLERVYEQRNAQQAALAEQERRERERVEAERREEQERISAEQAERKRREAAQLLAAEQAAAARARPVAVEPTVVAQGAPEVLDRDASPGAAPTKVALPGASEDAREVALRADAGRTSAIDSRTGMVARPLPPPPEPTPAETNGAAAVTRRLRPAGSLEKRYVVGAAVVLLVLAGAGFAAMQLLGSSSAVATPPPTTTSTTPQHPKPDARPVLVPALIGASQAHAIRVLKARGLRVRVAHEHSTAKNGHVISQVPRPGKRRAKNALVRLVVSTGPPKPHRDRLVTPVGSNPPPPVAPPPPPCVVNCGGGGGGGGG